MEERWLVRRNRDLVAQNVGKEQRAAVSAWAERRARVEEEITRNAEVARFQSDLSRRGYHMPTDAEIDIPATIALEEPSVQAPLDTKRTATRPKSAAPASASARGPAPPRYDVSDVTREGPQVRFSDNLDGPKGRPKSLNGRIAQLRKLHAHLLAGTKDPDVDAFEPAAVPTCVFDTEEGEHHASLSAYRNGGAKTQAQLDRQRAPRRENDTDILANMCECWRQKHATIDGLDQENAFEKQRFEQMQEVEAVKRVMARKRCPIDSRVLERALVMPSHVIKPQPETVWKPEKPQPKKKKKKLRRSGRRRSNSNSSRRNGSARRSKSRGSPPRGGRSRKSVSSSR